MRGGRRFAGVAFHGKSQRRIGVVGRLGLVYGDVGEDGGAAAMAVRLARDLFALHAKRGWRSCLRCRGQLRQLGGQRGQNLVEVLPRAQPAPGFHHRGGGFERLKKALRAAFVVHQRAVAFGEGGGRKHQFRVGGEGIFQVFQHHDMPEVLQEFVNPGGGGAPVQIVFENNQGLRPGAGGLAERRRIHQRQAQAVALRDNEGEDGSGQRPSHIGGGLNDFDTPARGPGHDQGTAGGFESPRDFGGVIRQSGRGRARGHRARARRRSRDGRFRQARREIYARRYRPDACPWCRR